MTNNFMPTTTTTTSTSTTTAAAAIESAVELGSHLPVYVEPETLQAGENVRPDETPDQHQRRIEQLATLIESDGQLNPIRIREEADGRQLILAGQGRRDALVYLNNKRRSAGDEPLLAWCVIDTSTDPLRRAIVDNFARTQNTPLEIASLMRRVRDQHGWKNAPGKKGEGANKKLAAYFGIHPADVTQYEKLGEAPDDIKARLNSGEMTMNGALTLLKVTMHEPDEVTARDVRKAVADKAREIAEAETPRMPVIESPKAAAKAAKTAKSEKAEKPAPAAADRKPVRVTGAHIAQAAAAVTQTVVKAPTRRDVLDALAMLDGPVSTDAGRKFVQEFLRWADGDIATKKKHEDAWVALNGTKKPATAVTAAAKPVEKVKYTGPKPGGAYKPAPASAKAGKAAQVTKTPPTAPRGGKVAKRTSSAKHVTAKTQPKASKAVKKVVKAVKVVKAAKSAIASARG